MVKTYSSVTQNGKGGRQLQVKVKVFPTHVYDLTLFIYFFSKHIVLLLPNYLFAHASNILLIK